MPKKTTKPRKKKETLASCLDDYYSALRTIARKGRSRKKIPGGHSPSCWPMRSTALSVHPRQVKAAAARAKALGVPTEFHPSGDPIFTSRGHRAAYMKHVERGVYDRDGGYGDAQCGPSTSGRFDNTPLVDFGELL